MLDTSSQVEPTAAPLPQFVRSSSAVRASFAASGARTALERLAEHGSLRMRMMRAALRCEATLVNTGGGISGGDSIAVELGLGTGAHVCFTSQAAEKIYRTDGPPARVSLRATLGDGARLDWLPQETILFDNAALVRSIDIDLTASATLTLLECMVLGRTAHGETLTSAHWHDTWRIRRGRQLVFADAVRLSGPIAGTIQRSAIGNGARALATLLHIAPDAEAKLEQVRSVLPPAPQLAAASAWSGMLIVRCAATDAQDMRARVIAVSQVLAGAAMPRAWMC